MEQSKLNEILEKHKHWVDEDCDGWRNMRADLAGAYLTGVKGVSIACPTHGSFIAWKKAKKADDGFEALLVKLLIPEDARRSSATSSKCRCDKAKVIEITDLKGIKTYDTAVSSYDDSFIYKVGETVSVDDFCENRFAVLDLEIKTEECSLCLAIVSKMGTTRLI